MFSKFKLTSNWISWVLLNLQSCASCTCLSVVHKNDPGTNEKYFQLFRYVSPVTGVCSHSHTQRNLFFFVFFVFFVSPKTKKGRILLMNWINNSDWDGYVCRIHFASRERRIQWCICTWVISVSFDWRLIIVPNSFLFSTDRTIKVTHTWCHHYRANERWFDLIWNPVGNESTECNTINDVYFVPNSK